MKQKLQHLFIIFFMMNLALCAKAEQKTVALTKPGTISQYIPESEKNQITDLTVKGDLNGTDVRFLREMAGVDIYGQPVSGSLVRLDLTDANIVEGGDFFFVDESIAAAYYTSNNVISSNFMRNSKLQECLLPKSVKAIYAYAFANSKLKSLTLPEGLEEIGPFAFENCKLEGAVTIPASVKVLLKWAFVSNPMLENINVAEGNEKYASVDGCVTDKSKSSLFICAPGKEGVLNIAACIKTVESGAFYSCSKITGFSVESGNTTLKASDASLLSADGTILYAYAPGRLVGEVVLPDGVELIEAAVFQDASITGVTLPQSLKTISINAFFGCKNLSSVSYANGVEASNLKAIGNTAFGWCDSLKDFLFPSSIETIGNNAFCYCTGLEHVVTPKNLKNLGKAAFYGCTSLSDFELLAPVDSIQDRLLYNCISLKTVKIPEGVKSINQYAFAGCKNLKSICFPESLEFIGDLAFVQTGLKTIIIPKNVKELKRNIINAGVGVTVYSMSPVPPMAISGDYSTFGESTGVLYVPTGCKAAYMAADGWKDFKDVDEFDPAGVASVETDGNNGVTAVYTIDGNRIDGVQRGMNIVKGKDGRVHKVVVRQ